MSYERNTYPATTPTDIETHFRCPAGGCAKLTTDNYSRWKADIKVLLTALRAIEIVLGTEEPPLGSNSVAAFTATDNQISEDAYIDKILTTVPETNYTIRDKVYGNLRDFRNVAYVVNAQLEYEKMKLLDDQCRKYQREVGVAAIAHAKTAHLQPIPASTYTTMKYSHDIESNKEDEFTVAHALIAGSTPSKHANSGWLIDSGASHNLCPDWFLFSKLSILSKPIPVYLGDGTSLPGIARGEIRLQLPSQRVLVVQAQLVPKLHT
ncbi:hypothetical protein B9Z19DRAFT_1109642 [Tuber borchii]|uniref:Retrovirus-related Pol polyprotein from transposon TNT 1-94-like beta-barrel domain-containing protein n=1 Tax=Tuber borchii TaxID=42251 RepID=A0A2T6ZKZ1_TUBBO|nr:hypothetical protein B9Z19DRAFT_1109642 [Tuber borchii]